MKKLWKYSLLLLLVIMASCEQKKTADEHQHSTQYTCPMHPQIIEPQMSTCPICAMDLVKVGLQRNSKGLTLMENQIRLAGIKTIKIGENGFEDKKLINARLVNNPLNTQIISVY